jgi:PAS domain S-box-containing protein
MIVRGFATDRVLYWSRGAEDLYGWTPAEALDQVTHSLLRTQFPESKEAVDRALRSTGQWAGELVHVRRDGHRVVVASRQAVHSDELGQPLVTLEINTDITQRRHAEGGLRESEERFRLLVEGVQDYAIFMVAPDGTVVTWNEGARRLKGYELDEIIGRPITVFYTDEDLNRGLPQMLLRRAEEEGRAEYEGWRVRKDGNRFWANVVITALWDDHHQLRGFVKITRDLSARKEAEEARARASREEGAREVAEAARVAVQTSRDQLAAILAGVTEGITVLDTSRRMLFANDAAARLCGFASAEELLAAVPAEILNRFELLDESGSPFPLARLPDRLALDGHSPAEVLIRFRIRATGEERWSLVNAAPIRDELGQVAMEVSIFRDITERKRAEDAAVYMAAVNLELTRSLEYEQTLKRIAELTVPTLADWCVVDLLESDGTSRRVAVAHPDPEKRRIAEELSERYPEDPNAAAGPAHVMRTGRAEMWSEITDMQLEAGARDAEHLAMLRSLQLRSIIVAPLIGRGQPLGAITVAAAESARRYGQRDLSVVEDLATRAGLAFDNARLYREAQDQAAVQVRLNGALREAEAQLRDALQTRDEFLAAASHDLKNPIAAIKATTQLLQRRLARAGQLAPEQLQQGLASIDVIATRAGSQVDELLDVARLQLGRPIDLDRREIDLVALVEAAMAECRLRTDRHRLSLETSQARLIGSWDEPRLARVVANLLDNAVKYSPEGGRVGVELSQEEEGSRQVAILIVTDDGVGIPAADIDRIFDRFQRGSNVQGQIAGTGIGLASARHIVESHGGTISAVNRIGRGAAFTIHLPLSVDVPAERAEQSP